MKFLKVVGLLFIIDKCQAFHFSSENDYNQGVKQAKTHPLSDCVEVIAVYDKIDRYAYGTATALSPTVMITASHIFETRENGKSFIYFKKEWHPVKRHQRCPKPTEPMQFPSDDIAVLELESPLSLSRFPTLSLSVSPAASGISIGYGTSGWSGRLKTGYIDKTSTSVSFSINKNKSYRQWFETSGNEGTTSLKGFKALYQPTSSGFAFGMPGDSGAPVFNDTGNLVALYTHNLWYLARHNNLYRPNERFCDLYCSISLENDWLKKTLDDFGVNR